MTNEQQVIKELEIDLRNANFNLKNAKDYIKQLEDDFFKQAFCAALQGIISNSDENNYDKEIIGYRVRNSIMHAQEAVRQVGELNKEQARDS